MLSYVRSGSLLMDAPAFESVEQLVEMAGDREAWRNEVRKLLPKSDPDRIKGRKRGKSMRPLAQQQQEQQL